jgi:hypothetical protein
MELSLMCGAGVANFQTSLGQGKKFKNKKLLP